MLWHTELKCCMSLSSYEHSIKFECRQFPSIFVGIVALLELKILETHSFLQFLLHALTYCAEILHMTLFYCTTDQVWVSLISVGEMPLLELTILEIHSFSHFSPTCFDILSWNCANDFILLYCRSSSSVVNLHQFLYARLQTERIMVKKKLWWCLSGSPSIRLSVRQ